jgi:hypothetical protein
MSVRRDCQQELCFARLMAHGTKHCEGVETEYERISRRLEDGRKALHGVAVDSVDQM